MTQCDICSDPNIGCGANSRGEGTEATDKRQRQKQRGGDTGGKTEGDVVDTLYVYLPAGVLWLNLLSPSFSAPLPASSVLSLLPQVMRAGTVLLDLLTEKSRKEGGEGTQMGGKVTAAFTARQ